MKLTWNFLGGGVENKNLPWGKYGYFLELHNIALSYQLLILMIKIRFLFDDGEFPFFSKVG